MMVRIVQAALVALTIATGGCDFSQEPATATPGVPLGHVRITKTGTRMGAVTFFHRQHKKHAIEKQKCDTCHHAGKWEQPCGMVGCHRDPIADADGRRLHRRCIDECHRGSGGKAPTDCSSGSCHAGST